MLFSRIISRFSLNTTAVARPTIAIDPRHSLQQQPNLTMASKTTSSQKNLKSMNPTKLSQKQQQSTVNSTASFESASKQKSTVKKIQSTQTNAGTSANMTTVVAVEASLSSVRSVYDFARLSGELKQLRRQGWTQFPGIKHVESVADHSWRMGLLCMLLSKDKSIDVSKCMRFSLIHDLSEVVAGDITPHDGITETQKQTLEENGMQKLLSVIGDDSMRNEIYSLWREYEDRTCIEAKLVKDLDRYEMLLQAFEYEQQYPVDLTEFFVNSAHKITQPIIVQWLTDLLSRREEFQLKSKNAKDNNNPNQNEV